VVIQRLYANSPAGRQGCLHAMKPGVKFGAISCLSINSMVDSTMEFIDSKSFERSNPNEKTRHPQNQKPGIQCKNSDA
jgi:hypothetical protein